MLTDDSSVAEAIDNYTHLGHLRGVEHGVNYKLAAPLAALGLVRLHQLEERIAQRRAVAQRLLAALPVESPLAELQYESGSAPNYYTLVLHARRNVRAIAARLGEGGLPSDVVRWGYRPLYERPVFARWRSRCPNAEALIEATFHIPVHPAMSETTLDHMASPHRRLPSASWESDVIRHFTASGILLHDNGVLLVKHGRMGVWLYPGGHVDPNEDPVDAVIREIREEVGLEVDIIAPATFDRAAVRALPPPFTILVEDVTDTEIGPHQHIDMIYVCRATTHEITPEAREIDGHAWVPIDRVDALDTPAELPALVAAAVAYARGCTDAGHGPAGRVAVSGPWVAAGDEMSALPSNAVWWMPP